MENNVSNDSSLPSRSPEAIKNDYIVGTLFLATSTFGFFAYIPCMMAMYKSRQMRSACYTFMFSLGISDCCSLIGWFVVGLDTVTHGNTIPKTMVTVVLCFLVMGWGSLTTHEAMIAINRFCAVFYPTKQEIFFSKKRMIILLGVSWFYAVVVHAAATFIPPNMYYSLDGYYAVWYLDDVTAYYTYEDITCVSTVTLICVVCYASIMIKYARVRGQMTKTQQGDVSKKKTSKDRRDTMFQFRLALQTAVRCLTFFVYDLLYYIVSLYSTDLWAVFVCSTYLWCLNNAISPWVYLTFNEQMRRAIKMEVFGWQNAILPETTGAPVTQIKRMITVAEKKTKF